MFSRSPMSCLPQLLELVADNFFALVQCLEFSLKGAGLVGHLFCKSLGLCDQMSGDVSKGFGGLVLGHAVALLNFTNTKMSVTLTSATDGSSPASGGQSLAAA